MRWHTMIPVVLVALIDVSSLAACGEPMLRNVPKADPATVAGAAAAVAAAATLADPQAAAKQQEHKPGGVEDNRGVEVKATVPPDVFDRLDSHPSDAGVPTQTASNPSDAAASSTRPSAQPGAPKPAAPSKVTPVTLWPISTTLPEPTITP